MMDELAILTLIYFLFIIYQKEYIEKISLLIR